MSVERRRRAALALACAALGAIPASALATHGPPRAADRTRGHAALIYPGPTVQLMVVGAGNVILSPAREITSPATAVQSAHGPCGIAQGTPLGVLVALRHSGGPPFSLHDYGHCTSSPSNSGQLFVYSLDGETNHGQNGWEYKVDNRSGTTGAADPSGPFGSGRLLRDGDTVVWFWCQSFAGGCQRNLGISVPASVAPGASFPVKVTGYDNEGRGQAMSGARVSVQGSSAVTGSTGKATLRAPSRAGPLGVHATRPGSVPSFGQVVQVR